RRSSINFWRNVRRKAPNNSIGSRPLRNSQNKRPKEKTKGERYGSLSDPNSADDPCLDPAVAVPRVPGGHTIDTKSTANRTSSYPGNRPAVVTASVTAVPTLYPKLRGVAHARTRRRAGLYHRNRNRGHRE